MSIICSFMTMRLKSSALVVRALILGVVVTLQIIHERVLFYASFVQFAKIGVWETGRVVHENFSVKRFREH